ncbi:MAG TPA: ABC transporter permease [Pyrinomonadaceae bacterium]|jgi:putative ABC transport system permease protein
METLWRDVRYSWRVLTRVRGFTTAAIVALALGIGANTAIFSLVNAVLLHELPFEQPSQLVWIWSTRTDRDKAFFSVPDFIDYREQTQTLEEMAAFANWNANLTDGGEPERLQGVRITANAFKMLGVEAVAGRTILPDDGKPGSPRVVLISYGLWQRRFGGERNLVGRSIALNGDQFAVAGVLPPDFIFPGADAEIAVPLILETDPRRSERDSNFLRVYARLKPNATLAQAQSEMAQINARLREQYMEANAKKTAPRVLMLRDEVVGDYRKPLLMLLGAVALVLLIACANLANMLLARASGRGREVAIRVAIGATRLSLVRQLLTESLMIALAGGAAGFLLAWWGIHLLLKLSPADLPRAREVVMDTRVLAFSLLVSLLAGIIFGLMPAVSASKVDLNRELKGGGHGTTDGGRRKRTRSLLVVSEVALSLLLLIGAGLFIKSFLRLQQVNPGFDPHNTLAVRLSLPPARYKKPEAVVGFYEKLAPRIMSLPGVEAVGVASVLPLSGSNVRADFTIVGRPPLKPEEVPAAQNRWVSPGYFQLMRVPILKGREFDERDTARSLPVVVIDEALARRFWPDGNPVGEHLKIDDAAPAPWREVEIVGVVRDVKHNTLLDEPTPTVYAPIYQSQEGTVAFLANNMSLAVRTSSDPLAMATIIRREVREVDGDVATSNVRSMEQFMAMTIASRRFNLMLVTLFAGVALLLAATGIYAVVSYTVAQRTKEIGIRMALGARTPDVVRMILGHGLKLTLLGVAVGLAGAFILTRVIANLLFDVTATDPATFILMPLILLVVALLACFVPARRATRVDPLVALRME